jgi:YHS domain-containing protein
MKKQLLTQCFAKIAMLFVLCLGLATQLDAQTRNLEKSGRALQGYDPVAFFTEKKPVKGEPGISSKVNGATYYFSKPENKAAFDKEPAKYEPQFGGYCAYGVAKGSLVKIEVDAFQIVNGRLLLQYNKSIRDKFNKDPGGNLEACRCEVAYSFQTTTRQIILRLLMLHSALKL